MSETTKPKSKAAPGWYADKERPGLQRRWTGVGWIDEWRATPSFMSTPEGLMVLGFGVLFLGGIIGGLFILVATRSESLSSSSDGVTGLMGFATVGIAAFIGGTVFIIGVIAKGVQVGSRQ